MNLKVRKLHLAESYFANAIASLNQARDLLHDMGYEVSSEETSLLISRLTSERAGLELIRVNLEKKGNTENDL